MGELFGALGLAWPRLLLYPGGLFALVGAWMLERWIVRSERGSAEALPLRRPPSPVTVIGLIPPLVVLTLLPLAPARSFPYGLDLVGALALLEWPRLLELRQVRREQLAREYGPLVVATLGMAGAVGGIELTRLLLFPDQALARALLLAAAALWLAALPRLLSTGSPGAHMRLRALGLVLLPALPLLGALAWWSAPFLPADRAGWILPPLAILLAIGLLRLLLSVPERVRGGLELGLGGVALTLSSFAAIVS